MTRILRQFDESQIRPPSRDLTNLSEKLTKQASPDFASKLCNIRDRDQLRLQKKGFLIFLC